MAKEPAPPPPESRAYSASILVLAAVQLFDRYASRSFTEAERAAGHVLLLYALRDTGSLPDDLVALHRICDSECVPVTGRELSNIINTLFIRDGAHWRARGLDTARSIDTGASNGRTGPVGAA